MMEIEICPFCKTHEAFTTENGLYYWVECALCASAGPRRKEIVDAITDWNDVSRKVQDAINHS